MDQPRGRRSPPSKEKRSLAPMRTRGICWRSSAQAWPRSRRPAGSSASRVSIIGMSGKRPTVSRVHAARRACAGDGNYGKLAIDGGCRHSRREHGEVPGEPLAVGCQRFPEKPHPPAGGGVFRADHLAIVSLAALDQPLSLFQCGCFEVHAPRQERDMKTSMRWRSQKSRHHST